MSRPALAPALQPDVGALLGVIRRQRPPRRVHNLELFLDPEVKDALSARFGLEEGLDRADPRFALRRDVRLHAFLGYDVFRLSLAPKKIFDLPQLAAADTAEGALSRGQRDWTEEHTGPIRGWQDFEAYPWPRVRDIDLSPLEWLEKNLPGEHGGVRPHRPRAGDDQLPPGLRGHVLPDPRRPRAGAGGGRAHRRFLRGMVAHPGRFPLRSLPVGFRRHGLPHLHHGLPGSSCASWSCPGTGPAPRRAGPGASPTCCTPAGT